MLAARSGRGFALAFAAPANAAGPVKIGVIWPLTGNAGAAGQAAKAGAEVVADIVNNAHPELGDIPLAKSAGLPNLGGAKLELIFADHQGNPSLAQQLATRLITQDKVNALLGSYQSSCSFTATAVAERYGIPFMVGASAAANITGRGFKFVFRGTPIASDYARTYMRFFADMKKEGKKIGSIAVVNENTDYGTSVANAIVAEAKKASIPVAIRIPYSANSTDVTAQVLQLKQAKPDVVIFISYTSDAILYMKTMKNLDYKPPMVIGDDTGFSDPSFIPAVADIAQGVMNRSAWAIGKPGSVTAKINDVVQGAPAAISTTPAHATCRASSRSPTPSTAPARPTPRRSGSALTKTDLKGDQIMMGYQGVKFDKTGQNILAATYLIQLHGKKYDLVWPAKAATAKLQWPMAGWTK